MAFDLPLSLVAALILGSIIGSFMNVVLIRFNTGRTTGGRSACSSCRTKLSFVDLIPVVSYLALRGKCRHCGSRFSSRYMWGELLTALLLVHGVLFAYVQGLTVLHGVLLAIALLFLLFISLYDMRHMVVPMVPLALFLAVSLMFAVTRSPDEALLYVLAGVLFGGFFLILFIISRGKWVGGGDAPVALGIGMLVGIVPSLLTLIFASYIGTAIYLISHAKNGILRMVYSRHESSLSLESEIPFVPLLFAGAILASWTAPLIIAFIWP